MLVNMVTKLVSASFRQFPPSDLEAHRGNPPDRQHTAAILSHQKFCVQQKYSF